MKTKISIRIKEKAVSAIMIAAFLLALAIYSMSVQAQGINALRDPDNDQILVSNAVKNIHLIANANGEIAAEPLHAFVNSPYAELKPTLSPDGTRLYFSRAYHPDNTFGETDAEDIWYSSFDKTSDTWSEAVRMTGLLNNDGPNFIDNVSTTGDTIILGNQYGKKGKMRAGLSYSVNVDGQWLAPVSIKIQNDYNMSNHDNAFVSLKSGVIIKAIQRGETFGERDLYVSFWDGEKATEPVNMGGVINTSLEESSPFLADDNKTLYFASKGHAGYGGYDIFVTTRLDDSWTNWSEPQNLGTSVNGRMDDEFFSITKCGKYAVFSKQVSVHNVNLFKITTEDLFGKSKNNNDKLVTNGPSSYASL